jgi:DNA gyrase subunit A
MRLQKLIGLEVEALIREHEETLKKIAFYMDVLEKAINVYEKAESAVKNLISSN